MAHFNERLTNLDKTFGVQVAGAGLGLLCGEHHGANDLGEDIDWGVLRRYRCVWVGWEN